MVRSITRRRRNAAAALLLGLLLVGMQTGAQLHAIGHFGEWMQRPHDLELQLPDDDACAICALFAGGANAAPSETAEKATAAADFQAPREPRATSAALASPSPYQSRAPPLIP